MSMFQILLFPTKIIWKTISFLGRYWPYTIIASVIIDLMYPEDTLATFKFFSPVWNVFEKTALYFGIYHLGNVLAILAAISLFIYFACLIAKSEANKPEWEKIKNKEEQRERAQQEQKEIERKNAEYIASKNHPCNAYRR